MRECVGLCAAMYSRMSELEVDLSVLLFALL